MARSRIAAAFRALRLLHYDKAFPTTTGLLRSFREDRPVDASGAPLPWVNYALIDLLEERLRPDMRVFEYGSGYSTLFFASRCRSVTSVEHDAAWLAVLRGMAPANVRLIEAAPGPDYVGAIDAAGGEFDVVLVDGLDRERCLARAPARLTAGGVVILDDSHRAAYGPAVDAYLAHGFRRLRFAGPKPNSLTWAESTLLYRDDNGLGV